MHRAVYPGTFDPVTRGHLDLIERSQKLCDDLVLGIAMNDRKGPLFTAEERKELMEESLRVEGLKARVVIFDDLLVDFVRRMDARVVLRGVRAFSDFEYEFQMALMNRRLFPDIETVFLMPHESYSYVSSRMVKEVVKLGKSGKDMVLPHVEEALLQRFEELAREEP